MNESLHIIDGAPLQPFVTPLERRGGRIPLLSRFSAQAPGIQCVQQQHVTASWQGSQQTGCSQIKETPYHFWKTTEGKAFPIRPPIPPTLSLTHTSSSHSCQDL